jgi:hypothetical protein
MNPLLRFNWKNVRLLSINSEALAVSFVMEKGEPVSITFDSLEELDMAYKEWVELTESFYRSDTQRQVKTKVVPDFDK